MARVSRKLISTGSFGNSGDSPLPPGQPRPSLTKLARSFYSRPTLEVAKDILGKYLVRRSGTKTLIGKIVEVEAYLGSRDPASHAYRGRTERNAVMFGRGGHLYVYFTYGMHFCANVVTEQTGIAGAILIRGVEPVRGTTTMVRNRRIHGAVTGFKNLTNGPARFCQAFGIGRKENGIDLLGPTIYLTKGVRVPASSIRRSGRVGIRRGTTHKWRFFLKDSPFVSRPSAT
jgi:DNA-3-methyladenine glycosylase